mgnify:FL=1
MDHLLIIGPAALRLLRCYAALLSPCREVRVPVCMSPLRIEWDA